MLTYADVCWRMLTYADVCCGESLSFRIHLATIPQNNARMLTYADVCCAELLYFRMHLANIPQINTLRKKYGICKVCVREREVCVYMCACLFVWEGKTEREREFFFRSPASLSKKNSLFLKRKRVDRNGESERDSGAVQARLRLYWGSIEALSWRY
jgi:hypothetical protein